MIRIQPEPFDAGEALDRLSARAPGAGAIVAMVGKVRGEGGRVGVLTLDHYPGFTDKRIGEIVAEAEARFGWTAVSVIHRHGPLTPGEAIVFVGVAAPHRRTAFDAADHLMDRLKTEAPFWKREEGSDGARWIEPRPEDHHDRARWEAI